MYSEPIANELKSQPLNQLPLPVHLGLYNALTMNNKVELVSTSSRRP